MSHSVSVRRASFVDQPEMPLVHTDDRRTITELVNPAAGAPDKLDRLTRIAVAGVKVPLGNHYHDFDEIFEGTGGGVLYTAHPESPEDFTAHDLPAEGWTVTIPAGIVHTFVVSRPAVLVSRTDRHFVSDANRDEHPDQPVNTYGVKLNV